LSLGGWIMELGGWSLNLGSRLYVSNRASVAESGSHLGSSSRADV
jgi:hypothetical protein